MKSSNQSDKNLSEYVDETTALNTNATAHTRPTPTPSNPFRSDRERRQRAGSPSDRSKLVRALSGLLHTLVRDDQNDDIASSTSKMDGPDDDPTAYTERTASKGEYGSRTEPVDGVYGHTSNGDPVVAPTGRLAASRIDANWTPGDTLSDPDTAGAITAATGSNASFLFAEQFDGQRTTFAIDYDRTAGPTLVDPSGERMIGIASGLETTTRTAPAPTQDAVSNGLVSSALGTDSLSDKVLETLSPAEQARLLRLRALNVPTDPTPEDTTEGVPTAKLEVLTPERELTPLGELFAEPEQFSRSSLESIEYSLALQAEMRRVTDGILSARVDPDIPEGEVELVGHAKWLANRFDEYASKRPSTTDLADARAEREADAYKERIRPLTALDADQHAEVSRMVDRLLSDEFDRVAEIRKSRLTLALALAKRLHAGATPTNALLRQADAEATDPRNVLRVGNIRYTSVTETRGRFSTQGTILRLFENTHPEIKQAGLLQDETGVVKFAIWKKSEWDETRPTPDPTDDGRTLIKSHRHPELQEGYVVRCEEVLKRWYNGDPTFETRRDSTLTIVDRPQKTSTSRTRVQESR